MLATKSQINTASMILRVTVAVTREVAWANWELDRFRDCRLDLT